MAASPLPPQVTPPRFSLTVGGPSDLEAEVVALPVAVPLPGADAAGDVENDAALVIGPGAVALDERYDLLGILERERATGSAGEVVSVPVPEGDGALRRILLVGVGAQRRDDFRRAGAALARATRDVASVATSIPALEPEEGLEAFVVGAVLGSFNFNWRSSGPAWHAAGEITLAGLSSEQYGAALARAEVVAHAGWRARFLATVPSNLKNPAWLAEQAREVADGAGLEVRVWDEEQLAAEGFGGILAVGKASATPPRLIRLDYAPPKAGRKTPTVVLVGKGITFDTGGLSIKNSEGMATMKRDMTGGAVVLATMAALAAVGCPVRVVGLIAAAENAISGTALRPGDVITHYGGRTSEVTNTDAEGRLVLADAMAYAVEHIEPDAMVDIATLTGAMKVALGQHLGGYFANQDALAGLLAEAADLSGEPLWRMPLAAAYEDKLASTVADADNAGGGPGAITAALFLQHFAGGLPWAHLDVASIGDAPEERWEWTQGPTGFGARLLLTWLGQDDPLAGVSR
ncbi:leucyl aminopeptidase family protein [Nocardioides sp. BP30]|uniref:leucyl aminopeptidase family protein n=1 Tax=Nocardioides sp. BP30 TaxID=3036374 RepID=UPI0024696734|nr:leucyl aminopeptidase family protein [Nocardioides sp. BP30]WGL53477.1 leucyl aminopeptidase family protein [Nocardioides sp. BP30]